MNGATVVDLRELPRMLVITQDLAEEAIGIASRRLADRVERRRQRRSQSRAPPRCPTCHKFKGGYGGLCKSCGFDEGSGYPK
jgi:hypothetical protein